MSELKQTKDVSEGKFIASALPLASCFLT